MNNFLSSFTTECLIKLGGKKSSNHYQVINSLKSNNICIVRLQVKYKVKKLFYEIAPLDS